MGKKNWDSLLLALSLMTDDFADRVREVPLTAEVRESLDDDAEEERGKEDAEGGEKTRG